MNAKQFFDKVVEMRQAQREYFRTRMPDALQKSKKIETEIDREIKRVQQIKKRPGESRSGTKARLVIPR